MAKYNYHEAMYNDIVAYIEENKESILSHCEDIEEVREYLYDELFVSDSVTGNASGSYTFDTHMAEGYIAHNLHLYADAVKEFDTPSEVVVKEIQSAEMIDVIIRCYLLGEVIGNVLNNIGEEIFSKEEDNE